MPRVLVVEDEPRLRDVLAEALRGWSFDVTLTRSGEEALRVVDRGPPDVLLLDLHLPGLSGLETCAALRTRGVRAPAVVLTGYGDLAAAQRAMELGVVAFLTKPFRLGELERALARARTVGRQRESAAVTRAVNEDAQRLQDVERRHILRVLELHAGNRTATAKALGISRRTLQYRLTEYGQADDADDADDNTE